jgi:membrane protease YdiL (CAAX protease family)
MDSINRKRVWIFAAIAFGVSTPLYVVIWTGGGPVQMGIWLSVLMFAPMIAHIATRLITREGWSNTFLRVDLRDGRWRYYLAAWFLPLAVTIVGGAIYYLLFPGRFDPSMAAYRALGVSSVGSGMASWAFFMTQVGIAIAVPWSEALLLSFGEEFGWRAYLLPKLMALGPRKAVLLVGVIWAVWHWPSIYMGFNYGVGYWGAPVVGPLLFVLVLIFESAFYAWVTLRSGSVWPAALGHGASNAANRLGSMLMRGEPNPLVGPGIQGIIGSLGYAVLALLIILSPRALAQSEPAPVDVAVAGSPGAVEKAAHQAKPGTAS